MGKVVYNGCYGGFSLSREAATRLLVLRPELDAETLLNYGFLEWDFPRHDKDLVHVVESMKAKGLDPSGKMAELRVADFKGNRYRLCEYDGLEWVETPDTINWIEIE